MALHHGTPLTIAVWYHNNRRSRIIAHALHKGAAAAGYKVDRLRRAEEWRGGLPPGDIAAFYGLKDGLLDVMRAYQAAGKPVMFVDLGYWGRHDGGRHDGYHKIAVGGIHPGAYLRNLEAPRDRFDRFDVPIDSLIHRPGGSVVVAGMSAKSAWVHGFEPQEWERAAILWLTHMTRRPIIYWPKPTWDGARPIPGATMVRNRPLDDVLQSADVLMTHHSNSAVHAALAGVPVIVDDPTAPGFLFGENYHADVGRPKLPSVADRFRLACQLAYCQWKVAEIVAGEPFVYLRSQGIIP